MYERNWLGSYWYVWMISEYPSVNTTAYGDTGKSAIENSE